MNTSNKVSSPKLLVCGRTASGKSMLASFLADKGLKLAESYTTRPKRSEGEKGHHFISHDEFISMSRNDMLCATSHNGYTYFMTKQEILDADVIVIDPRGVKEITAHFPDISFHIAYVHGLDEEKRKFAYLQRVPAEKKIEAEAEFNERNLGEDEQFTEFDAIFLKRSANPPAPNITVGHCIGNDYTENSDIFRMMNIILHEMVFAKRLAHILNDIIRESETRPELMKSIGLIYDAKSNRFTAHELQMPKDPSETPDVVTREIPPSFLIEEMMQHPNGFYYVVGAWLSMAESISVYNLPQEPQKG